MEPTNPPQTLLVLAGGLGSRYHGLKQIDGITPHGESILEFSVFDALGAGFTKFVFIINPQIPAAFVQRITAAVARHGAQAHWITQEKTLGVPAGYDLGERQKPWGTGQAVLCAQVVIAEPFAVINADDFYGREIYPLAQQALAAVGAATYQLMAFPVAATLSEHGAVARGVCRIGPDGLLVSIEEQTSIRQEDGVIFYEADGRRVALAPDTPVSMNFWVFDASIFEHLATLFAQFVAQNPPPTAEFYLPRAVQALVAAGRVRVRVQASPSRWMGVTYAADKARLVQFVGQEIARGRYPNGLWS